MSDRKACDDREAWSAARQDPNAFGVLFDRHAQAVYDFCCWRTGDRTLSEDLTSTVFLEAWRRRQSLLLSADCVLPWLLGVANNLCRNTARTLRRHAAALRRMAAVPPEWPSVEETAVSRASASSSIGPDAPVWNGLTDAEREIVVLVFWSGLTYEETSAALHIPVGTVRSRVSRTRQTLQQALSRSGQKEESHD